MTYTRIRPVLAAFAAASALVVTAGARQAPPVSPGANPRDAALPLFDGKTLNGWRAYKKADAAGSRWTVQDGTITLPPRAAGAAGQSRDIVTVETYDYFELAWEWQIAPGGNSGVKYFVLEDRDSAVGHEYQLIDDQRHADAKVGPHRQTAALYDVLAAGSGTFSPFVAAPAVRPIKPAGEWNQSRIRVAPSRINPGSTRVYHYLNDARVLEYELDSPELRGAIEKSKFKGIERFGKLQKGHILLQDHGDQVWYRNIRIARLSPTS